MKRAAAVLRGFTVALFLFSLLSPLSAFDALAQDQPGSLTIALRDDAGNLLAGGRFKVTDADGSVVEVADETDGLDGYTVVNGLAAGDAAVVQTGGPATHSFNSEAISFAAVPAGGMGELRLTNALIVQQAQVEVVDTDNDGTPDDQDTTPTGDTDGDGIDNATDPTPDGDPDTDGDGATDSVDNCVNDSNDQLDTDADGAGDACDEDDDADTLTDAQEAERGTDPLLADTDADGAGDAADNCAVDANADQADNDGDGLGNACDDTPDGDQTEEPPAEPVDTDEDGVTDDIDNCADAANDDQLDTDGDGQGDACDDNDDNDSHPDAADNCPIVSNKNQLDRDNDGIGNACDDTDDSVERTADFVIQQTTVVDVDVDFTGVHPGDYDHTDPNSTDGDYSNERETLNGGDFFCGDYVHFLNVIEIVDGSGTFEFTNGFATTTSNGDPVGFSSIAAVFVDFTDSGNENLDNDETATLVSQVNTGPEIVGTILVSGLDEGETIVVRVSAQLSCGEDPDNAGGVVQARHTSTFAGDQTVNLTGAGQIQEPNIGIAKTADAGSVVAGSPIGFTITLTNSGTGEATGVAFNDPLPGGAGIDWSESPDQGSCTISGSPPNETLDCSGITLAANGGAFSVHVTSPTTAASCGTYDNTATLTAGGTGSAGAVITVTCPDVSIAKTADASPINAGATASYTITVTNEGDVPATNVEVTETLPGGTWTLTPSQGTCSGASGVVTCDLGTIPVSGSATITVSRTTTVADCGTLTNQASVTADTDIDAANNGPVSADVQVVCPDVSVEKSTTTPTVDSGGAVNYTVTVTNNGPGTADVTVTDDLPDEVTWTINPAVTGCSIDGGGDLDCTFDDMAPGTTSITLTGTVPADFCGTLSNTVSITVPGDTNIANNTSETVVITVNCADVGVVKTPDGGTINAGELASFSILVTNDGPGVATDVTLSDTLPDAATWDVAFPAGVTCEGTPGADTVPATGSYTCDLGDLNDGASVSITVSRTTTSTDCTTLTNTATVAAANEDPAADTEAEDPDQSDTGTISVQCPGVSITKTGNGTITAGETASFTIAVSNAGPGTATGVVLTDDLPDGIVWDTVVEAGVNGGAAPDCTFDVDNNLSCTAVELDQDEGFTVTVSGPTDNTDCGTIPNTAQVQVGNDTNPNPIDSNLATVVVECPDITVTKVADDGIVSAGDPIGFTIAVTNLGPGTATGVVLSDELPDNAGLSWTIDTVTPTGGLGTAPTCDFDGEGDLLCDAVNLAPNQGFEVAISSPTTAATCGQVSNTANVTATNETPATPQAPNSAIDTIQVQCPDVTVEKSTTTPTINSGDPANFTIVVTNIGNGTATNVTVTDPLPDGVDWNTATPGCAITPEVATSGQTLNCTFASLAPGADVEITVTVSGIVPETFCGPLTNPLVTVDAENEADADAGNNTDGPVTITVSCPELTIEKDPDAGETGAVITAGDSATFTITVDNVGAGTATNVVVTDNLPDGINWDTPTAGCAVAPPATTVDQVLTCNLGDVEPGDPPVVITVSGVTDPSDCATLTNSASVDADNGDEVSDDGAIDVNCPDVVVAKEPDAPDDPGSVVNAGDPISFTITVTNVGDGEARGVQFNDSLPAGIDWAEASDPSDVCAITGAVGSEVLECGPTDLAPAGQTGDSFTVTVTGTTDAADCGAVTNTVTISADNELNIANNSDSGTITVNCPDVTVEKSTTTTPVNSGDPVSFSFVVRNLGAGVATNVTLTDELPDGVNWNTATPGCAIAPDLATTDQVLDCTFTTLAANNGFPGGADETTVIVTGTAPVTFCGPLTNLLVTVDAANEANGGPAEANNTDGPVTITVDCPDLVIAKAPDAGTPGSTISAGDVATFIIVVDNVGAGTATNVVVTDELPDGVPWTMPPTPGCFIEDTGTAGDQIDQLLTCNLGNVAPENPPFLITVNGLTDADDCRVLNNLAIVTGINEPTTGSPSENNDDTGSITVQCSDVTITKSGNGPLSAGETATFTIEVTNTGPGTATGVVLTDDLPDGIAWDTIVEVGTGGATPPDCSFVGGDLSCTAVDLDQDEGFTVTVSGPTDNTDCGTILNTAQVQVGNDTSPDPIDSNEASIVVNCPDVEVFKEADEGIVNAGEDIGFTITVSNNGPGTATGVVLTDTLPATAGLSWTIDVNVTDLDADAEADCAIAGSVLSCDPTTLDEGESFTIHITSPTTADTCGTVANTAEVSATNEDPAETEPNQFTDSVAVQCPNVTVEKSTTTPVVNAGDPVSYTIEVANDDALGTGAATGVVLTDELPAGVDWSISATTGVDAGCAITGVVGDETLACGPVDLAAGEGFTVTVTGTVDAGDCPSISNQASLAVANDDTTDPILSNEVTITVNCPDLTIQKEPDAGDVGSEISAGETATFTITVDNIGLGTAYAVTVSDELPDGVPWDTVTPGCSITDTGTAGDLIDQALSCTLGDVDPDDAPVVITVSGLTDADDCGVLDNLAAVTGTNEPTTGSASQNNSDAGQIEVLCSALDVDKTPDGQTINAGETATFQITVDNTGEGTAFGASLTDTLPTGLWDVAFPAGVTCEGVLGPDTIQESDSFTCDLGDIDPTDPVITITVSRETTAADCITLNNEAEATSTNGGFDEDTGDITVLCPDVTVEKTTEDSPANSGDEVSYVITVRNSAAAGIGTATDVELDDILPGAADGVVWAVTAIDPALAATCDPILNGALHCDVPTLAAGASVQFTITATIPDAFCGELVNQAFVDAANEADTGPAAGNNESESITIDVQCPELVITKEPDAPVDQFSVINATDQAIYTIRVTNNGPGIAQNVTVSDTLPDAETWAVSIPAGVTCDGSVGPATIPADGSFTCDLGDLADGEFVEISINRDTAPGECGTLTNLASAIAANDDEVSDQGTIIVQCPDVDVEKSTTTPTINAGDAVDFTIAVSNSAAAGAGAAYDVVLTDDLPDGVTWSVGAVTPTGGLPAAPDCVIDGNGDLDCSPINLEPGEGFTVTVTGTVDASDCPSIANQATITVANDDTTDPILSNEVVITVNCPAVTVVKTTPDGSVSAGEDAVYQIVVSNAGPGTAYDVVLTDELPEVLSWTVDSIVLNPDGTEPTCATDGDQNLSCTAVDLLPGQSLTVTLSAPTVPADCGEITNQAFAQVGNDATESPVASGIVPISINCSEVEVDKTADEETVNAGDEVGFTITVTNTGDGTAFDATLTDDLPDNDGLNWTIDSVTATGGLVTAPTCDFDAQDPGIIVCTPVDLEPSQGFEIHLSSPTTPETCGTVLNQVQVTLSTEETIGASADVVVECPSVLVTKTTPDGTISAGEDAIFDITVINNGAGLAKDVTLTDTLPAGPVWSFIVVDVNPDQLDPGCSLAGNAFECGPVDLDTGQFFTIRITGETDAADCGPLANTASVTVNNEPITDTAPNEASATVTVECPDLDVDKTGPASVNAGEPITFTVTVTNNGDGDAFDVELTDNLPASIDWIEVDGSDTDNACTVAGDPGAQILTCTVDVLPAGESLSVQVTGLSDAADCAGVTNTVTVEASNEPADVLTDNSATATVDVNCPDVDVTKAAGDDEISAGDTAQFTITVVNNGEGTATGVALTDDLPAGIAWTIDSVTPINNGPTPSCSTQTGDLVCDATSLDPGEGFEVRLSGLTDAADCATLTNTALVQVGNDESADPIPSNEATIDVLCPDVSILKEAVDAEVSAGESVAFRLTVTNDGPGEAKGVEFSDTLPANVDWAETNDPSNVCELTGAVGSEVLHCGPVDLGDGESFTVTVTGTAGPEDCGDLVNTVTLSVDNEAGSLNQDNTSTATITVLCPDVEVTKTTPDDTVSAGENAVFVITVANTGEGVATNVNLSDTLPAGPVWSFVVTATTPDQLDPGCSLAGNAFECGPVTLGPGEGFVVTITGVTDQNDCRDLVNTATVTVGNEATGALDDNESGATVTVECPDLVIEKSAASGTISAGETAGYTITVTNDGPGQAFGVTLDDTLPAGIVWTENPDLAECSITGLELSCAISTLDEGEVFSVTVEGETNAADCGTLQNQATADATNDDEVASELIEIVVDCPALTVVKEAVDGEISAGEDAAFTITVTNNGDGAAFDVELTDDLPAGIDWAITASTEASCEITGAVGSEVLDCGPMDLISGAGFSVTVAGATDAADCGTITNTATVDASNLPDQQTALVQVAQVDSNTATIEVSCPDLTVVKEAVDDSISSTEDAAYTITVTNDGEGVAFDVTLIDELPDGIPWTTETAGCAIADNGTAGDLIDQVLTCALGDLDPEESASVLVTGETDPSDCGDLVNTATADPANGAPVTSGPATIDVLCQEITIEKTAGDGTISAGETASFTITVGNVGEGDAFNVTIEDELPAGVDWVEAPDLEECEIVEGVLSCDVGTLGPEETFSVTVEGETDAADCGTLQNQASADASNDDEVTSELIVITVNCPDLTVVKVAEFDEVNAGEDAVFVITVTNNGDGTAFDVELTDNLPAGIDWAITASTEESCAITGAVDSEVLSCGPVDLAGEGGSFSVTVAGATDAADCGTIENSVTVSADNEIGLLQAQAGDSATMEVNCPDVTVEKTGNGPIAAGAQAVFTLTLRNVGAGDALDVTLTDNLPDDLDWSTDPAVEGCAITDGTLDCAFAVVPTGATITITVKAQTSVDDCGDLVNTVSVGAGNEPEEATGNNEGTATIAVQCGGVSITKVVCGVAKARDVAFLVTEPDGTTTGDDYDDPKKCRPAKDIAFTIDGDGIPAPETVNTGADGTVSLQLPPGIYTITEVSTGASAGFTVHAKGTTQIKVFNFEVKPAKPTPTPDPTPETPTKLPDTGAGPAGDLGGQPWLILFLTLVVIGGAAYTLRRRTA